MSDFCDFIIALWSSRGVKQKCICDLVKQQTFAFPMGIYIKAVAH